MDLPNPRPSTPPERPPGTDERSKVGDPSFWEAHYASGAPPWDKGAPAPPLVALWTREGLRPGRMLVPGAGLGHDAIQFARLGCQVVAVDFVEAAVAGTRERAAAAGVALTAEIGDVLALDSRHDEVFDYVLEHTCFCAIAPERRDDYVRSIARVMRPGGLLLGLFYNHARPGGPPFDTSEAQVRRHFSDSFEFRRLEPAAGSFESRAGKELLGLLERRFRG